jgi:XTP/dITP diphosphohydrolase
MKLIFATQNQNKVNELKLLMPKSIELLSLKDINCSDDIPETAPDLQGNASQKSAYVVSKFKVNCFADDTGLEIEALNNAPGVYSARYAGEQKNANDNMNLVLENLKDKTNRKARFRTVISLVINGKEQVFEGEAKGEIILQKSGIDGFGYDPIFKPEGYAITFAEMSMAEKNKISHRGKAVRKLVDYLATL